MVFYFPPLRDLCYFSPLRDLPEPEIEATSHNAKKLRKTIEWERRDFSKKIVDIKGIFLARMGTIKDRNGEDLTEVEEIEKRWQEYTEELYKKGLNDLDNHDGAITPLELDILEFEVKCVLGSITTNKASGGDGFQLIYFKS